MPAWRNRIKNLNFPQLGPGNKKALDLKGVLLLYVNADDLEVVVWLGVVNELAATIRLELCS